MGGGIAYAGGGGRTMLEKRWKSIMGVNTFLI